MLAPWKKNSVKPRQHIKKHRHHFANKGLYSQSCGFSSRHVWMWKLDHKEGWALRNWCFQTVVLEKTLENPLDCKEIKPVNPKRNESWIFIGKIDAEAEAPTLWPPDTKYQFIGKDVGKYWSQKEKRVTEDEMVGWHHWFNGNELGQTPGDSEVRDRKVRHAAVHGVAKSRTRLSNWTELRVWSNSCPLSQWCHPTISSSVVPFSSRLQSFPASGSFPMSGLFTSGDQSIGASASASVFPMNIQGWFPLELIGLISLQSTELSRVFSNTAIRKLQFFSIQSSLWSNSHIYTWLLEKP